MLDAAPNSCWKREEREVEAKREALLSKAKWTRSMEFEVGMGELNSDMMAWLRLVFASAAEPMLSCLMSAPASPRALLFPLFLSAPLFSSSPIL